VPALLATALLTALLGLGAEPETPSDVAPAVRVLRAGGLKMESVALLVSGEQGGSIHVAVLPLFFPGAGGKVRVPIVLEIDGATLLKRNTGDALRVEVYLYAVARKSGSAAASVQGSLLEAVAADLARAGAAIEGSGLQYTGELSLAPGEYSLRVLVRNGQTGEVGLRLLDLTVPDFGADALLLAPVFSNPAPSPWVAALSRAGQTSGAMLADGRLPAAQPVLGNDQEVHVELPVWNLKPTALSVEVLRPDGGHVAEFPARIESRREAAGIEWLTASFIPQGLETGRYQLRAKISGAENPPAWASPFVLLAGGGEGKVWAELMHVGQSPTREAGPPPPARKHRRLDVAPIRNTYRQALQLLAGGKEADARRAVAALETPLFTGPEPADSEDVTKIELDVAQSLAAVRPQSLVPIVLLHASLYRDAQQRRDFLFAVHLRETVFALTDLFAERGNDQKAAARLLVAFASQIVEIESPRQRERLFRQALTYDPDEPAAHLCLAAEAEREGRYPEAVAQLEELLRTHPENAEARLRLAVSLRRLGKPADADRLLDRLIHEKAVEPWVLALAYQETGRALLASGRLDDAERSLRAGVQSLPADEKLLFQLASVFDLRNDPAQARQILAGFRPAKDSTETPRHRYNRVPSDALNRAWNDLVRSAPESLSALAEALR
jgi:Flp pilus assembly protein TadD